MKLCVFGASGRMGRAVTRLVSEADDLELVGAVCGADDPGVGRDAGELAGTGPLGVEVSADAASALLGADAVVDFSVAGAVRDLAALAAREGVALVSGTTGIDPAAESALDAAAKKVPVLWAPNMSLGIQVLAEAVTEAVRKLGPEYDVEIVELHHRRKVDAPSGTAHRLADAAREGRERLRPLYGREGKPGARSDDEMGVFAVRGGDVIGDHTVYLLGPAERVELSHRAIHRDLFAHGALSAARFLRGREPGRYTIRDVVAAR